MEEAIVAVVEVRRSKLNDTGRTQTYKPSREAQIEADEEAKRIRLTQDEIRTINYVLVSWDSESGAGSNFGAMAQAIANRSNRNEQILCNVHHHGRPDEYAPKKKRDAFAEEAAACRACREFRKDLPIRVKLDVHLCPEHEEARPIRRATARVKRNFAIKVAECSSCQATSRGIKPHAEGGVFATRNMTAVERWVDKPAEVRAKYLRCWRTLRALGQARNPSLVILTALYGDRPPGLPQDHLWHRSVDRDYRRVVKFVEGSGGSGAALDARVAVNKHHKAGEDETATRARVMAAEKDRRDLLEALGKACERLIVRAASDFRAAWREQP